jgi:predicted acetyltransferase
MMHRLLEEARSRGDVLATLHASETAIYRRFGFGLATDTAAVAIEPRAATPWRLPAPTGTVRLLAPDEVQGTIPPLYERVARWRVGSISRPAWMWERRLAAASGPAESLHGKGTFVAVHADPTGIDDGYVVYEVEWDEGFARDPVGAGVVHDLWGAAPATEIELWRFVLGVDLVVRWTAPARPVDEPVRRAMHDARAYETRQRIDEQWVRVLDVDVALGSRTYGPAADPVVVGVTDPVFAGNNGTWSLSADGAARSREPADVEVDVATIGAVYLGGVSWHQLAALGAVRADRSVVDRLDALFGVAPAPFCGTMY